MDETTRNDTGMTLEIGIVPARPDAGGALAIAMTARGGPGTATEGLVAVLLDGDGRELATAPVEVEAADGTARASLDVAAPASAGDCCWSLLLRARGETLAQAEVKFEVGAHVIRPIVWDVPASVTANERFRFQVGLRCSSSCNSANWAFVVEDETGAPVMSGVTGNTPAPGTDALHFGEVEVTAPAREGRYLWRVRAEDPDLDLPHAAAAADIHFHVVSTPDHLIRVTVIDALSRKPVDRARVVAHPFRAVTNDEGRAEIAVPAGSYKVFVSGLQYFTFQQVADVARNGDVEIIAEMHVDRPYDEVDQWA